jgi:hypothetical protein
MNHCQQINLTSKALGAKIRWIEDHIFVPEGRRIGEKVELLNWVTELLLQPCLKRMAQIKRLAQALRCRRKVELRS